MHPPARNQDRFRRDRVSVPFLSILEGWEPSLCHLRRPQIPPLTEEELRDLFADA